MLNSLFIFYFFFYFLFFIFFFLVYIFKFLLFGEGGGEKYLQESCQGVRGLKEALETLLISFFTPPS